MRKISWNLLAKLDYFENIDFLLENWSEKEAQQFINEVNHIEFVLNQGNVDFQQTDLEGVKRVVIIKQSNLFYRTIENSHIEFLRFWNNNKNIDKLNF